MKIQKALLLCMMIVAAQFLSGCESEDERKLAAGQSCLDRATTTADANACISIVQGLESESAYLIRCSANFIAQGFTASRMASAFQRIKENTGGGDPMVTLLGYFVFQPSLTNNTADDAVTNCTRSNVRSMLRLASAAQLATTFATLSGISLTTFDPSSGTFDATQMLTAITNASGNATSEAAVGQATVTAAAAYCNEGSSYNGTEVCTNLNAAIAGAGTNYTLIGQQLIAALQTNSGN